MYVKILEILWENSFGEGLIDKGKSAKEIISLMKEFIEWLVFSDANHFYPEKDDKGNLKFFNDTDDYKENLWCTFDEVFDYWLREVKNENI